MATRDQVRRFLRDIGMCAYDVDKMSAAQLEQVSEVLDASKTRSEVHAGYAAEHERAMTEMARELADARLALAMERAAKLQAEAQARMNAAEAETLRSARLRHPEIIVRGDDQKFFEDNTALWDLFSDLGLDLPIIRKEMAA